jgi:hypothetical protein
MANEKQDEPETCLPAGDTISGAPHFYAAAQAALMVDGKAVFRSGAEAHKSRLQHI